MTASEGARARGVELVSPRLAAPEPRSRRGLPKTLDGAVIGLLANGKAHGEELLDLVLAELGTRHRLGGSVKATKGHPSLPPTDEQHSLLVSSATVAISAIGDCGSCSSCSVRDGIQLDTSGVPTVVVITEPFRSTAAAIAAMAGVTEHEVAVLPHPTADLDAEGLSCAARSVADQVEEILLGPR